MSWKIVFTKQALKDAKRIEAAGFKSKVVSLLDIIRKDPYSSAPPFEKLVGDLSGADSRRINIQHRLVYQILSDQQTIKVIRMWTHYE
ncbi:MAG: Txe/YoeB family addiction module toxin [Lentisphaeria bacterium]|nr:Txe/YoeB family addiction module toxin [Candidatus Neomarinimicrobiota bacterium]MCF7841475.1 Txe/YoeB family addiction module toxin [Lentisphaeria bacterium]